MLGGEFRLSRRGQQKPAHPRHCVGRTFLSASFDNGDFSYLLEFKINFKCSGQECPLYTDYLTAVASTWEAS